MFSIYLILSQHFLYARVQFSLSTIIYYFFRNSCYKWDNTATFRLGFRLKLPFWWWWKRSFEGDMHVHCQKNILFWWAVSVFFSSKVEDDAFKKTREINLMRNRFSYLILAPFPPFQIVKLWSQTFFVAQFSFSVSLTIRVCQHFFNSFLFFLVISYSLWFGDSPTHHNGASGGGSGEIIEPVCSREENGKHSAAATLALLIRKRKPPVPLER